MKFTDVFIRRPVLAMSQAGSAVGYLLLALATWSALPETHALGDRRQQLHLGADVRLGHMHPPRRHAADRRRSRR